jgi:tetratricopeptide (TPR) repeat protein
MAGYAQKRLQGKDRLHRVHRIRTLAYAALAGVTGLFVVAELVAGGAQLKPLFLPIAEAIELALLMALIATIVGGYLRHLEIRHAATDSQRFLLAREGMGRSGWMAGVGLACGILLILPLSGSIAGDLMTEPPLAASIPALGSRSVNFTSPDTLGLSYVRAISVSGQPSNTANVLVTVYRDGGSVASGWVNNSGRITFSFDAQSGSRLAMWSIVLDNQANVRADVAVVAPKAARPALFGVVPFVFLLLGSANAGWWFVARPIRERTRGAAVFAGGVETRAEADERFYVEYAMTARREQEPVHPPAPRQTPAPSRVVAPAPAKPAEAPRPSRPIKTPVRAPRPKAETPESLAAKGQVLLEALQPDAALAAFDESVRLAPAHAPALLGRAACLHRLGKRREAEEAYRRVLDADRTNRPGLAGFAALLVEDRRWREALEVVDEILRIQPHDSGALERRGDILANLGRRPEALGAYEAAFALNPTDENLRQRIEEVKVDVPGLLSRALIASASGNYELALRLFDDILEIEPGNVNALIGKSVGYRRSGKAREALNCLDLVLGLQPNNVAALLNRGHILEAEGDLDGALEAFDRLVSLSTLDDEAWAAQGDILVKMGRDDDALRAYAEALKLNPGDELIRAKVAELEEARTADAGILQELYEVKGIGPAKAKTLIDAGYRSAEDFALATIEELVEVKGVTRKLAENLIEHFADLIAPRAR